MREVSNYSVDETPGSGGKTFCYFSDCFDNISNIQHFLQDRATAQLEIGKQ